MSGNIPKGKRLVCNVVIHYNHIPNGEPFILPHLKYINIIFDLYCVNIIYIHYTLFIVVKYFNIFFYYLLTIINIFKIV